MEKIYKYGLFCIPLFLIFLCSCEWLNELDSSIIKTSIDPKAIYDAYVDSITKADTILFGTPACLNSAVQYINYPDALLAAKKKVIYY